MSALGAGVVSFTAQNYGAGEYKRIRKGILQANEQKNKGGNGIANTAQNRADKVIEHLRDYARKYDEAVAVCRFEHKAGRTARLAVFRAGCGHNSNAGRACQIRPLAGGRNGRGQPRAERLRRGVQARRAVDVAHECARPADSKSLAQRTNSGCRSLQTAR